LYYKPTLLAAGVYVISVYMYTGQYMFTAHNSQ